ncbi:MAG: hypothetical protein IKG27_02995 [Bacilli bacterium]|nr:hypothetical protein [Bacilli bacterium]
MKKNIILSSIFILLTSVFNTLYKYIIVKESINNYNNASFGNTFMTSSSVETNYGQIFLFSLLCLIIISILIFFILYFINKKNIKQNYIFNLSPLIIAVFIGIIFLFINKLFSFMFIIAGIIINLYFIYRKSSDKKVVVCILIFILITIYLLYKISS